MEVYNMAYTRQFINPYPDGWQNNPSEATPIDADALQAHTDALEGIDEYLEDNMILDSANLEIDDATLTGGQVIMYDAVAGKFKNTSLVNAEEEEF